MSIKGAGDPSSTNKLYNEEEMEVAQAVAAFRRERGINFPSTSQFLHVMKTLGYERRQSA